MIVINHVNVTHNVEAYKVQEPETRDKRVRNPYTGKLYTEETGAEGVIIRRHVLGLYIQSSLYDDLKTIYEARSTVNFLSDETGGEAVECYIMPGEFEFNKENDDVYSGTIVLEEVEPVA